MTTTGTKEPKCIKNEESETNEKKKAINKDAKKSRVSVSKSERVTVRIIQEGN